MTDLHDPASPARGRPRFLRSGEVAAAAGVSVRTPPRHDRDRIATPRFPVFVATAEKNLTAILGQAWLTKLSRWLAT
jgi:hypothetical protein